MILSSEDICARY